MSRVSVVVPLGPLREEVERALEDEAFEVAFAESSHGALTHIQELKPAVVVLELFLEEQTGLALCRTLRETAETSGIRILMLTSSSSEMDRILAFEMGADDVLPRPFYPRELALRIRALLGHAGRSRMSGREGETLQIGPLTLDLTRQRVAVGETEVKLTERERSILALLMRRPGRVFSRREILETIWGTSGERTPRVVDTHVKGIRRKLGTAAPPIQSLRGIGYRLADASE